MIWVSPSHITLAIWVRLGLQGMPISLGFGELGCPYHCDTSSKCPCSLRGGRKKGMGWRRREKKAPLPVPLPLSTPASQSGLHIQWKLDMTKSSGTGKKFVRNNEFSFYRSSLSYIFVLLLGQRKLFLIPRTWLYRGSTVWRCLAGTNTRSHIYRCVR